MSVDPIRAEDIERAREAVHRGELSISLVAKEGERFALADVAKLCSGFNRLMRTVTKEVAPNEKVEWCVTGVGLVNEQFQITVGGFKPKPRSRRKKGLSA